MKTNKLLSVAITALVALASTAWAGPYGGGGGGHFSGFSPGRFGGAGVSSFNGGGIRAAPTFSGAGGARFSGNRSIAGLNRTPQQQFSYYTGAHTSAAVPRVSSRQVPN